MVQCVHVSIYISLALCPLQRLSSIDQFISSSMAPKVAVTEATGRQAASFVLGCVATLTVMLLFQYQAPPDYGRAARSPVQFSTSRDQLLLHCGGNGTAPPPPVIARGGEEANITGKPPTTATAVAEEQPPTKPPATSTASSPTHHIPATSTDLEEEVSSH